MRFTELLDHQKMSLLYFYIMAISSSDQEPKTERVQDKRFTFVVFV